MEKPLVAEGDWEDRELRFGDAESRMSASPSAGVSRVARCSGWWYPILQLSPQSLGKVTSLARGHSEAGGAAESASPSAVPVPRTHLAGGGVGGVLAWSRPACVTLISSSTGVSNHR